MSIRSTLSIVTVIGMSLVTTSVALARNPPALVRSQEVAGRAEPTSGYRDSLARVAKRETIANTTKSAGYRDSLARFVAKKPVRVASQR
jgi:hypothetical protein